MLQQLPKICLSLSLLLFGCAEGEDKKPSESSEGIPGYLRASGFDSSGKISTDHGAKIEAASGTVVVPEGVEKYVVFWAADKSIYIPEGEKRAFVVAGATLIDTVLPEQDGSFSKEVFFDDMPPGDYYIIVSLASVDNPSELVVNTTKDGLSDYVAFELELLP